MEVNPDAYSIAAQLDRERTQGELRGYELTMSLCVPKKKKK